MSWEQAWDKVKSCTVPIITNDGIIGTGFFITKSLFVNKYYFDRSIANG
jgi:hypothetical protein